MERKILIIGLDSAPSEIVIDRRAEFPTLARLIEGGCSRQDAQLRPPDHHPRLDGHDHGQGRRATRPLRIPTPNRLRLR